MPELDVSIQPPARLKLMTTLTAVSEAEFATLHDTLQVSDSVLSKHVSALVAVGYVNSRKGIHAGRRTTWITLTAAGRTALSTHVAACGNSSPAWSRCRWPGVPAVRGGPARRGLIPGPGTHNNKWLREALPTQLA
jgi:DNA-binding MarR family transcriptional regulator